MENIRIIDYNPSLQADFESINKAWIIEHFTLEPIDVAVLEKPQENIIDHGGVIIFAELEGEIVGTVALKYHENGVYEMTKMGVVPAAQGKKVGWNLAKAILEKAKDLKAEKVVLYSSRKLVPAINMYRKLGFKEVVPEAGKYSRCDIKMEVDI